MVLSIGAVASDDTRDIVLRFSDNTIHTSLLD